jgi:hypothetical protein
VASTEEELKNMLAAAAESSPADGASSAVPHASELDHVYPAPPLDAPLPAVVFYGAMAGPGRH